MRPGLVCSPRSCQSVVEIAHQILRIDFVAEVDQEIDVVLIGAGAVEDRQAHDIPDVEEKLLEAAALARERRGFAGFCLSPTRPRRRAWRQWIEKQPACGS